MREHEVPTHVQAEDRVLLWFTFPQIVAITAVAALSYGAYRYAPVGPSEVRMAIAVLFGLAGIAMVVGKIGGRRLPLVVADLLKYRLGARVYAGPVSQLVRSEAPAPPQPVKSGAGPLRLMAKRSKRLLRRMRKKNRKDRDRRDGRMPFRPHTWFGKRRKRGGRGQRPGHMAETLESRRSRPGRGGMAVVAAVLLAMAAIVPQAVVLADDHEPWRDEFDFEIAEPVEGRRIFVEGLSVTGDRALVTLRAATDVDIRIRAFGGPRRHMAALLGIRPARPGGDRRYRFPLHGAAPSFTVSWEDTLGQAGALTFEHDRIPYPLPEVEGELCTVRLTSLGWTPGAVNGVVESECVTSIEHPVELQTVSGHESVTQTALMEAGVTAINRDGRRSHRRDERRRRLRPQRRDELHADRSRRGGNVHAVSVDASLTADLSIPIPPLTVLTHHAERTEEITETVSLYRPGASDSDSATARPSPSPTTTAPRRSTPSPHTPTPTCRAGRSRRT